MRLSVLAAAAVLSLLASPAPAQRPPDSEALIAAQREAMTNLAFLDGVWRGEAWTVRPGGARHEIVQTERIGTFLGGAVRVIEGRGYEPDGSTGFNAFGIISYDPASKAYSLRSYAMGHQGDFAFRVLPDGYVWEVPAGPGAIIRYTATVGGGKLREVGYRIAGEAPPVQVFEMNLRRVGDTKWPLMDPVPMRAGRKR
jgi:hypothetical protein